MLQASGHIRPPCGRLGPQRAVKRFLERRVCRQIDAARAAFDERVAEEVLSREQADAAAAIEREARAEEGDFAFDSYVEANPHGQRTGPRKSTRPRPASSRNSQWMSWASRDPCTPMRSFLASATHGVPSALAAAFRKRWNKPLMWRYARTTCCRMVCGSPCPVYRWTTAPPVI